MTYLSNRLFIRKYRAYALPFLIAFLILFLSFYVLKPKIESSLVLSKEMDKSSVKLLALTKKVNALAALDPSELKEMFNMVNTAIPSDKDIPGFMLGIGRIAQEASVSVGLIEVSPGSISTSSSEIAQNKKAGQQPITAKVTVTGLFQNIISFISKATNGRRLLKIEGINLSGAGAQKLNEPISMSFSISLYYQPLPESLGVITLPIENITDQEEKNYLKLRNFPNYSYIVSTDVADAQNAAQSGSVPVGKIDLFNR